MLHFDGAAWSAEPIAAAECPGGYNGTNVTSLWGFESGGSTELYATTVPCSNFDTWGYDGTYLHFDGSSWELVQATDDTETEFLAVGGTGPDDVWLAGYDGLLLHYPCE